MKQINQSIVIDAKVKATLEGMSQVVADLNKGLREGATKIDLTKGIGNTVSKQIEAFKAEYQRFANLTKDSKVEFADSKEAIRSGEQMIKTFAELKRIVGNFEELSVLDAKKLFPDAFDSRVEAVRKSFTALRNSIVDLDAKRIEFNGAEAALVGLKTKQEELTKALSETTEVKIDTEAAEKELEEAKDKVVQLREELKRALGSKLGETQTTAATLTSRKEEILGARAARGATGAPETLASAKARGASAEELEAIRKAKELYAQEEKELKDIEEALKRNTAAAKGFRKALAGADKARLKELAKDAGATAEKFEEIETALIAQADAQTKANTALNDAAMQQAKVAEIKKELDATTASIENQEGKVTKLRAAYETLKSKVNPESLAKAFKDIGIDFTPEMARNEQSVLDLQKRLNELDQVSHEKLVQSLRDMGLSADSAEDYIKQLKGELYKVGDAADGISKNAQEIQNLKNQVLQFFSLTNSVQLFKRAITSALNTVKELDATMTEAAVVTEFDIGDMWEKLPQYSEEAQRLGVSINGMYQATTLYYQQGLKTNEAMEVGVETMKMARIAGMDSVESTKAMTAALRGFNMELNQTSAQRVNDVYSQLAAVTAADTNQIATAMEKTASIAASANMEFETTAAFLSQIIETTQEAPETAGTALKTIIARFAEVKSLRDQGKTTGEDEEGEAIDVNKIQAALRTVGISMEGFFAGTEGLDSVLLKLSEKWSGLDFETQRYIATMAAGSRQQSRFIAMMSDYGRTTELVSEAQNSAGASQRQFEKTQESLATSLTKLKNAWDQFLMGLANNEILKAGVDGLTKILETINKITEGISGGNGLIKSVISLAGVLATLKGGKALLSGTAVGGAMSGLVGRLTGGEKGEDGQSPKKGGRFGLPEGANAPGGWSKEGWKKGYEAKRAELKANGPTLKERFSKKVTVQKKDVGAALGKMEIGLNDQDMSARATGIRALNEQLADGQITVEEAEQGYLKLGGSIEDLNVNAQGTVPNFDAMGKAANTAGMAMMAAGAATSLLAGAFESWGLEEEAEVVQTLSGVLMTLGPILMGIGSFLPVLTSLTAAQAAATWAALWPILLVVAALAALVAVIVLVAKHEHELSLEGRMQAAAEATERAKEAAEGAKQAYDDLLSDKSEYDTLQEKLDTLIKGTLEWKQALADSNAQVLELLDTYPELANYLTRGEHGELEITEKGWEIVQERQAQAVRNSNAAVASSQTQETKLQQKKARESLVTAADKIGIMGGTDINHNWLNQDQVLDIIYKEYKKNPETFSSLDSQGLKELEKQTNRSVEEIYKLKEALMEYDQALVENEGVLRAQSEALLTSAASAETNAYEYGDEIIAGFAKGVSENQKAKEDEIAGKIYRDDKVSESQNNEDFQKLMKENGLTAKDMTGDDTHDLEVLYAKMAGISREEIGDGLKGNKEALRDEIAKMQAAKEVGQDVDKVAEKMQGLNKATQKEYAAMISGDIDLMDQNIITKYGTVDDKEVEKIASDLGLTTAQLAEKMGVAENELAGALEETAKAASEAFGKTEDEIVKIAGKMPEYLGKASLGGLKKYATLLSQAAALGTKDTIQAGFDAIFNSTEITDEQKSKIISALDTFDWTQEGEGERFLEFLKTIGVDIEGIVPNMEAFTTDLKTVDALLKKIDAKSVFDEITNGLQEARDVAGQDKLTNEQYFKYLKDGLISEEESSEWAFDGEGWVNVSNGMDNLVDALKANTLAQLETRKNEAQKQIDWYNDLYNKSQGLKNQQPYKIPQKNKDGQMIMGWGLSPMEADLNNEIYKLIMTGKLTETDLKWTSFSSMSEYQTWYGLHTGGKDSAQNFLDEYAKIQNLDFDMAKLADKDFKDYDKYYSIYNELAELARQRERLEKQRNRTLQKGNAQLAKEEREKLIGLKQQEYGNQQQVVAGKTREINELLANKDYKSVIKSTGLKYENGVISFNEKQANNLGVSQRGIFDELLSKLEGLVKQQKEAEDGLLDIKLDLEDLYAQDREDYINATNEIKQALISEQEKAIDALREVNDSINDANTKMIEAMQFAVDKYRQDRDNERTESDIEDKQRRLAYLQQDTSGANAVEIMKLQKEIEQDQEAYTDSLIDQKIQELQDQNDKAAEQRERQIQILEAQLKYDQESGKLWKQVEEQLKGAFDAEGNLIEDSDLMNKLKEQAGFDSMSAKEREQWLEQMKTTLTTAKSLSNITRKGYTTGLGGNDTGENDADTNETEVKEPEYPKWDSNLPKPSTFTRNLYKGKTGEDVKGLQHALKLLGYYNGPIGGTFGDNTKAALIAFQKANNLDQDGNCGPATRKVFGSIYKYETGGLADFTGLAWLDGTKARPEYVLNADQTKAFFSLVDILSGFERSSSSATQNSGDTHFDIDINVETINDKADLDMISQYVEDKIVSSANYRNNNVVGRLK